MMRAACGHRSLKSGFFGSPESSLLRAPSYFNDRVASPFPSSFGAGRSPFFVNVPLLHVCSCVF
eukprot:770105-Pyramimonas_sp.AAC.1